MKDSEKDKNTSPKQTELQQIFMSIRAAPKYPKDFQVAKNGTRKLPIENKQLLEKLRQIEDNEWRKVYRDGYSDGRKISLHYFQSASGKVFDVKVKLGWSNNR
ncbi:MAG: hypothetical protein R3E79_45430 [Caldilineaceae bacterium]